MKGGIKQSIPNHVALASFWFRTDYPHDGKRSFGGAVMSMFWDNLIPLPIAPLCNRSLPCASRRRQSLA
jgi:hypothetical protein